MTVVDLRHPRRRSRGRRRGHKHTNVLPATKPNRLQAVRIFPLVKIVAGS